MTVAQAHHGQPHGQAGRISWRREKKGRFHESSWPLGGRLWAVVANHQIVGARKDQLSPTQPLGFVRVPQAL